MTAPGTSRATRVRRSWIVTIRSRRVQRLGHAGRDRPPLRALQAPITPRRGRNCDDLRRWPGDLRRRARPRRPARRRAGRRTAPARGHLAGRFRPGRRHRALRARAPPTGPRQATACGNASHDRAEPGRRRPRAGRNARARPTRALRTGWPDPSRAASEPRRCVPHGGPSGRIGSSAVSISTERREKARLTSGSMPARSAQRPLELAPRDAEPARELRAQLGLVQVACGPQLEEQPAGVEGRPAPVRPGRKVRDEHVGVKMRIRGAAGAMQEGRSRKAPRRHRRCVPRRTPCVRRTRAPRRSRYPSAADAASSWPDRTCGATSSGAERVQQAHRLRGRVRAVVGGDANPVVVGREQLTGGRVDAGEQRTQASGRPRSRRGRAPSPPAPSQRPSGSRKTAGLLRPEATVAR